jgi:hypothetical protein
MLDLKMKIISFGFILLGQSEIDNLGKLLGKIMIQRLEDDIS